MVLSANVCVQGEDDKKEWPKKQVRQMCERVCPRTKRLSNAARSSHLQLLVKLALRAIHASSDEKLVEECKVRWKKIGASQLVADGRSAVNSGVANAAVFFPFNLVHQSFIIINHFGALFRATFSTVYSIFPWCVNPGNTQAEIVKGLYERDWMNMNKLRERSIESSFLISWRDLNHAIKYSTGRSYSTVLALVLVKMI